MSLTALSDWTNALKNLPAVSSAPDGVHNFAVEISNHMDSVQAGPTGTAGIFTMEESTFESNLMTLGTSGDTSWVAKLVSAWQTAVIASSITSGTVTDPLWTLSMTDIDTAGSAPVVISTIASAAATLQSELMAIATVFTSSNPDSTEVSNCPQQIAKAFRDATLAFTFNCIGEMTNPLPPPPGIPVPKVFTAQ